MIFSVNVSLVLGLVLSSMQQIGAIMRFLTQNLGCMHAFFPPSLSLKYGISPLRSFFALAFLISNLIGEKKGELVASQLLHEGSSYLVSI